MIDSLPPMITTTTTTATDRPDQSTIHPRGKTHTQVEELHEELEYAEQMFHDLSVHNNALTTELNEAKVKWFYFRSANVTPSGLLEQFRWPQQLTRVIIKC